MEFGFSHLAGKNGTKMGLQMGFAQYLLKVIGKFGLKKYTIKYYTCLSNPIIYLAIKLNNYKRTSNNYPLLTANCQLSCV